MIEWFFLFLWSLWLGQSIFSAFRVWRYPIAAKRQDQTGAQVSREMQRPAAVVVAIKGVEEDTENFVRELLKQDYRRYRVIFAVEDAQDPAAQVVRDVLGLTLAEERWVAPQSQEGECDACVTEVRLVVAGYSTKCSQKLYNQQAAYRLLGPEDEIVACADADIRCEPDWLARLTAPINLGTHHLSTTYRWLVPERSTLVNHLASVMNASVATMGGPEHLNTIWGGSNAIAMTEFQRLNVPDAISTCLNDDLRVGKHARRNGCRIAYIRSLLRPSKTDLDWASLFEFARRQYYQVRHYSPILYRLSFMITGLYVASWTSAVVMGLSGMSIAWGFIAAVFFFDQLRALGRRRVVNQLFKPETVRALRGNWWLEHLATPFWMALHGLFPLAALLAKGVTWAGIGYRVRSLYEMEVIRPEKPSPMEQREKEVVEIDAGG